MDGDFTKEEVHTTLCQIQPFKASKEDGTPAMFYQMFWHLVVKEVTDLALQVLNGERERDLTNINKTLIYLIPKVKKSSHASKFRPISLCNVIFKILQKL